MKQQLRYEEGRITMVADIHDGVCSIKSELVCVSMNIYEKYKCIKKKKGGGGTTQSIHPCPSSTVCMCNRWKRSLVRFYQRKGAFPKWELDWNSSRRNVVNLCCWEFASGKCHGVVQESGNGQTAYITMTRVMWPTLIIWQLCGEKMYWKKIITI